MENCENLKKMSFKGLEKRSRIFSPYVAILRYLDLASPSDMDTKKIPPFWTGCPCRLRENWAGSNGAGFDTMGTVPSKKKEWAPKTPVFFS